MEFCWHSTDRGNVSTPGVLGRVSTVIVPPSSVWGHVFVLDFLTWPRTKGFRHVFECPGEQAMIQERLILPLHSLATMHE